MGPSNREISQIINNLEEIHKLAKEIIPALEDNGITLMARALHNVKEDPVGTGIKVAKVLLERKVKDTCPFYFKD